MRIDGTTGAAADVTFAYYATPSPAAQQQLLGAQTSQTSWSMASLNLGRIREGRSPDATVDSSADAEQSTALIDYSTSRKCSSDCDQ